MREGGTLVVPSRQRAYAVRLAQAAAELAAGRRVWVSADVLPLSSWLRREAERRLAASPGAPRVLGAAEEWYLWRQCARAAGAGLALVEPAGLARALQRATELAAEYGIEPQPAPAGTEAALWFAARREFGERCRALSAASVSAALARLPRAASAPAPWLRGFDALSPRLRALVPQDAAGALAAPAEDSGAAPLELLGDAQEELSRIAAWCAARLGAHPGARLLIVLPGEPGARERLATLIRQELDPRGASGGAPTPGLVGIEGGQPLAELPLVRHALTTLRFLAGEELEFESLGEWLRAPPWARPAAAARARLHFALRERGVLRFDLRAFLGALQLVARAEQGAARELGADLGRAAAGLADGALSPRSWAERLRGALGVLGWPGVQAADSAGRQTLLRWHELLEEFGSLSASVPALRRAAALEVLAELAAVTAFRPADEDVAVTVSGALADPVVRYDGIWVAGLSADVLPQPVKPDPYLPLAAQRAAGVPAASAAARLAQARLWLGAWRAAAPELVLSAPARAGDLELLASPLLPPRAPATDALSRPLAERLHRAGLTESIVDVVGERWNVRSRLPRGTRSLDLQNTCPFRAYAELRLGADPPESLEPGIPATVRGVLLHAALELLWGRLRDSRALHATPAAALAELIDSCVTLAAQALLAAPPGRRRRRRRVAEAQLDLFSAIPAALARECRRAARLIGKLCDLERTRPPFEVEQAEGQRQLTLAGATVHMRLDRIDRLADGALAVLDYKSGQRQSADWYGERPTHPQLLAYAAALGAEVAALATVNVTAREVRFEGIAREGGLLPRVKAVQSSGGTDAAAAWQERREAWRAILERLARGFLAGEAAVDPKPGACTYCQAIDICRIRERAGEEGADA